MRNFRITYKPIDKYNKATERNIVINVSKPTGDIGQDAHAALNLFISSIGSLKKNDVIEIQEINDIGDNIGMPIKPTGESSIVPMRK